MTILQSVNRIQLSLVEEARCPLGASHCIFRNLLSMARWLMRKIHAYDSDNDPTITWPSALSTYDPDSTVESDDYDVTYCPAYLRFQFYS